MCVMRQTRQVEDVFPVSRWLFQSDMFDLRCFLRPLGATKQMYHIMKQETRTCPGPIREPSLWGVVITSWIGEKRRIQSSSAKRNTLCHLRILNMMDRSKSDACCSLLKVPLHHAAECVCASPSACSRRLQHRGVLHYSCDRDLGPCRCRPGVSSV